MQLGVVKYRNTVEKYRNAVEKYKNTIEKYRSIVEEYSDIVKKNRNTVEKQVTPDGLRLGCRGASCTTHYTCVNAHLYQSIRHSSAQIVHLNLY